MSTFASTLVRDLDVDTIDFGLTPIELPGSAEGTVSPKQARVVLMFVKGNEALQDLTVESALDVTRVALLGSKTYKDGHKGLDPDFVLVEKITAQWAAASATETLTDAADKLRMSLIAALSGTTPHWDPKFQAKISALPASIRERLVLAFLDAETRGGFSAAMAKLTALVGQPASSPGDTTTTSDVPAVPKGQVEPF